ncbi:MAG: diacylglycerol kinase family lipid kinase [Anaerolineae bacterium]|nr:diacylglycerol kinase family lipid kinase [Anaerolineae bacterium]
MYKEKLEEQLKKGPQKYQNIHVVINPAAGKPMPVLSTLNTIFNVAGIRWDVSITKKEGDACQMAADAAENGVDLVAIYGGDGAVMEAAQGLKGTEVALGILPGGTANVMSVELGIPGDLTAAVALIAGMPSRERPVDLVHVDHDGTEKAFILRAGIGAEALVMQGASREMKDALGTVAYALSWLRLATDQPNHALFKVTIGEDTHEVAGSSAVLANSTNIGVIDLRYVQESDPSDGLIEVVVYTEQDIHRVLSLLELAASIATSADVPKFTVWQTKEVTLDADPPQLIVLDGEIIGYTPIAARVLPGAVKVVVPHEMSSE